MSDKKVFKITKRHYDIIIQQGHINLPKECGGFLGGKDMTISAILPAFNQHLADKTGTFAVTQDDIIRAHQFFSKHGLEYFGIYHTHPKGVAEPSDQDLKHIQQYMFIISYRDQKNPDFAAFIVHSTINVERIPLKLIKEIAVKDIHGAPPAEIIPPVDKAGDVYDEQKRLSGQLSQYLTEEKIDYPKIKPKVLEEKDGDKQSDFSTIA